MKVEAFAHRIGRAGQQCVEEALQPWCGARAWEERIVGRQSGELAQMVGRHAVEAQCARQGADDLLGGGDIARLLEPRIPTHPHTGQVRNFFATQPWRTPPSAFG